MRIVLLGPPGAGKGTQAVLLAKAADIPHISTGEMMRAAIAKGSPLGLKVKGFMDRGELVPDSVVIDIIRDRLSQTDCAKGFLLDGFPRTVDQVKSLDQLLKSLNKELTHIVEIKVADQILIERIKKRGAEGSGRSDDTGEVAAKRLQVYWAQTAPVAAYYREQGRLTEVDGLGSIEEVKARLGKVFGLKCLGPAI